MGWYRDQVLPRLVEATCGGAQMERWRARAAEGLHGRIVEIGFGSGLNVPVYPAEVTEVARRRARRRRPGAGRRPRSPRSHASIVHVGLDGQVLPDRRPLVRRRPVHLHALHDPRRRRRPRRAAPRAQARRRAPPPRARPVARPEGGHGGSTASTGIEQRVADGCHLTRDPVALVEAAGFTVLRHDSRYAKGPKPWTWMTSAVAVSP